MTAMSEKVRMFGDYPVGTVLLVPVSGLGYRELKKCRVEYTDKDTDACDDCVLHNEPDAACAMFSCVTGEKYKILREITENNGDRQNL